MADFDRKSLRKIFADAEIDVPKDVLGQICSLHTDSLDGLNDTVKDLKMTLKRLNVNVMTTRLKHRKMVKKPFLKRTTTNLKRNMMTTRLI